MGSGTFDPGKWRSYASQTSAKSTQQIFTSTKINDYLDPRDIKLRESCDSVNHPASTPIATFVDVTGSMGHMATVIAKTGLGLIMEEIIKRKPVTDPHLMFGAFGDLLSDNAPLQVSQFEVEVGPMTTQLEKIYLEGNGGGNNGESPDLAWYFCATRTKIDSFIKRQRKGYLFTVSDEPPPHGLKKDLLEQKTGMSIERDLSPKEVLDMASRQWHCFHLFLKQGGFNDSLPAWKALMPERIVEIPDFTHLAETIVSTIQVHEGADPVAVAKTWSGNTQLIIADAMKGIKRAGAQASGVVRA